MGAGDTSRLITGSADQTVKLWDVETGAQLHTFLFGSPARAVDFAVGDKLAVITTDPFMGAPSAIHVKQVDRESIKGYCYTRFAFINDYRREFLSYCPFLVNSDTRDSLLTLTGPTGRINRAVWGPLNKTIISAGEDAIIRIWDAQVCRSQKKIHFHQICYSCF